MAILVIMVSTLLSYLVAEIGYRAIHYMRLRDQIVASIMAQMPPDIGSNSIFDPYTGYRYRANIEVHSENSPFPVHWRTNVHGHIARGDYPVRKPSGEYRIGIVGDSFTANVTNSVRWADSLEDQLNASPEWRAKVKGERTRVINFGLDGIGVVQFDDVVERMVMPFDIDLLIVNMIAPDVARRPYSRGQLTHASQAAIEAWVQENVLAKLPWTRPYPEILAVLLGKYINLEPRLTSQRVGLLMSGERHFAKAEEAASASVLAVQAIKRKFPEALWLLHPTYQDYVGGEEQLFSQAFEKFEALASVPLIHMIDRLPHPESRAELASWFNIPNDSHNSDKGLRLYADAVAGLLTDQDRAGK